MVVLTAGAAIAWTAISCTAFIPPSACVAIFWCQTTAKGTEFRRTGDTIRMKSVRSGACETFDLITNTSQSIDYKNKAAGGSTDVSVVGYYLNL